jgi:hypothetical protein
MKIVTIFMIFFLVLPEMFSQEEGSHLRIMFWNAENVFDISDDPATNDDDFTPLGVMRWNTSRYKKKIQAIYKTIMAAGEWAPPSVIAFCEIENRKVLEDLIYNTYLSKYDYGIIHEESPDRRGIDVCMIFRKDVFRVDEYEYWSPKVIAGTEFTSRNVLCSRLISGLDTIHLVVNHWPSRRGGVLSTEDLRLRVASMVKAKTDSIVKVFAGRAKILITGDFNCTPGDKEINQLTGDGMFINLSSPDMPGGPGTYRYMGTWEMIDQLIVTTTMRDASTGFRAGNPKVFRPDFLLMNDPRYPGSSPFSTYRGYRYQGGFSDHLPVLIDLIRDQ